jgi:hypothetical protein
VTPLRVFISGTDTVSLIIPVEGHRNKFLISLGRHLATIKWDGEHHQVSEITKLGEVDDQSDTLDNRFNDGKVRPHGSTLGGNNGRRAGLRTRQTQQGRIVQSGTRPSTEETLESHQHLQRPGVEPRPGKVLLHRLTETDSGGVRCGLETRQSMYDTLTQ